MTSWQPSMTLLINGRLFTKHAEGATDLNCWSVINNIWQNVGQISTFQAPLLVGGHSGGYCYSWSRQYTNFTPALVPTVFRFLRWRTPTVLNQLCELGGVWLPMFGISEWITRYYTKDTLTITGIRHNIPHISAVSSFSDYKVVSLIWTTEIIQDRRLLRRCEASCKYFTNRNVEL
jgi:hypothetical protein